MRVLCWISVLVIAGFASPVLATPKICSTGGDTTIVLKDVCQKDWEATRAKKAERERTTLDKIPLEREACPTYIEKRYPACSDEILSLRESVDRQKDVVRDRYRHGWHLLEYVQIAGIMIAIVGTVAAAFADRHWSVKLTNVAAGALVTAATSLLVIFDSPGVYASELRATSDIASLQSEVENALVRGWVKMPTASEEDEDKTQVNSSDPPASQNKDKKDGGAGKGRAAQTRRTDLHDEVVYDWQERLSAILKADSTSYADSAKGRKVDLNKK